MIHLIEMHYYNDVVKTEWHYDGYVLFWLTWLSKHDFPMTSKLSSFEPELNQRPKDVSFALLQSSALPTELSKGLKVLSIEE